MDWLTEGLLPLVPLVILISARIGAALAAMPAPFGSVAPVQLRAALGVVIASVLTLSNPDLSAGLTLEPAHLFRMAVPEVLVGAVIGLTVRVTLAVSEVAGNLIGFSTGLAFANSVDPALGESAPPTARALSSLTVVIFLVLHGHHMVLAALAMSLEVAPPGQATVAIAHEGIVHIGGSMMAHGLRIAAPVVATMYIVQLGTALVSKAAPRVHLFSLSFAIAVCAGLLILLVATPSFVPAIAAEIHGLPSALRDALGAR